MVVRLNIPCLVSVVFVDMYEYIAMPMKEPKTHRQVSIVIRNFNIRHFWEEVLLFWNREKKHEGRFSFFTFHEKRKK